jgi:hypothetical protein
MDVNDPSKQVILSTSAKAVILSFARIVLKGIRPYHQKNFSLDAFFYLKPIKESVRAS